MNRNVTEECTDGWTYDTQGYDTIVNEVTTQGECTTAHSLTHSHTCSLKRSETDLKLWPKVMSSQVGSLAQKVLRS